MIIALLLIINALFYLLLMLWYRRGLQLLEVTQPDSGSESGITVVVAARNEAERLPGLLVAIDQQVTGDFDYELLLVNDCSTDDTSAVIAAATAADIKIRALATSAHSKGKKAAITLGVENARYPLIALCDADSVPQPEWLRTIHSAFTPDTGMVLGATRLEADTTLFSRIIQVEYAGILGIGLATSALGVPLFASGSNLAFRRQCFSDAGGYRGLEAIPSGDDTMLIQRVSRHTNWEIKPLIDPRGQVHSRAPRNFGQLLSQRARWSSTHLRLPDFRLTLIGFNAYLLVCSILVTGVYSLFQPAWLAVAAVLLLLKVLAETGFLLHSNRLQGLKVSWQQILVGQFWELLYIPISPLLGLTGLFRWRRK
jgi:poly-beta-1,6-N-acetyl-D-glucosamine synthase